MIYVYIFFLTMMCEKCVRNKLLLENIKELCLEYIQNIFNLQLNIYYIITYIRYYDIYDYLHFLQSIIDFRILI